MAIEQNHTSKTATAQAQQGTQSFVESARHALEPVQKRISEIPVPSKRTQALIAGGIALGAVGIAAFFMYRRRSRLGVLASLSGPAMVAWNAYQKAAAQAQKSAVQARDEIQARLH